MKNRLLTGEQTRYHKISKNEAIDIDTEIDFLLTEILLKNQ